MPGKYILTNFVIVFYFSLILLINMKTYLSPVILALFSVFILSSCNSDRLYKNYIKFPNFIWSQNNRVSIKIDVEEPVKKADVVLGLRYNDQFPFQDFTLEIRMISPDKESKTTKHTLLIRKPDESHLGECSGQICDLEKIVMKDVSFSNVGSYEFEVEHLMPDKLIPLVMDIGIMIDKPKKK